MAVTLVVNWSNKSVEELGADDLLSALRRGIAIGKTGDDVAVFHKPHDGAPLARMLLDTDADPPEPPGEGRRRR